MPGALVLYVDGDREDCRTTARRLAGERASFDCLTATSVADALDLLDRYHVDCVVSEYDLATETGLDLLRAVREDSPDLPVVLFTADGSESVASDAISAGVTDYVQRTDGASLAHLADRIDAAVSTHRAETELHQSRRQLARLHECAIDIAAAGDVDAVVDRALLAAERILEFDVCGVYRVDDDGRFEPVTDRSYVPEETPTVDDGILGKTYREDRSFHVPDVDENAVASPDRSRFRSALSIPIPDYGVFQAIAREPDAFSAVERDLAELLVTHVSHALDRLAFERDLRRTNERLQAILRNTTAHIYTKDREGRYQLVNETFADRLGLPKEDIVGKTDFELQATEHAEAIRENDLTAMERGGPVEAEEQAAFAEGESVYYSVKVPLYGAGDEPTGVCGISTDITEVKQREAELERQKERLDEFARLVSHDLKSPLSVAQGYLEVVREDVDHENLSDVATAHDRMAAIIEDVLTLARNGRQIGECERVRLDRVATRAWANVDSKAAGLDLLTDTVVEADPDRLQQAFENLFRNCIEHGGDDRDLTVRVGSLTTDRATAETPAPVGDGGADTGTEPTGFFVEDTGSGLGDVATADLFEPGFTTSRCGTGFGLAIVRDIVEAHGWAVEAGASDEGGARFEVTF
ncbi:hybrid sensor histidine kinase/response regulator [Haloarchaeobius amylolyticus]|uniref:hybrid sensor histidine kinase/response regulator n=1 Tax=Haloarchaeobius amylolyticus TaxID=1198296 RepID=UPI0022710EB2|nr:PAS domain-containing protein [Haloarchaeobius amylolyticus]